MGKNFKEWTRDMKIDYGYDRGHDTEKYEYTWRRIHEDWLVSTKLNGTYPQRAYHICHESWMATHIDRDTVVKLDKACRCGEMLPEGLRMVAMLLESL